MNTLQIDTSLHKVWFDFCKRFKNEDKYLFIGYELMQKVEKWAKKYPKDVFISPCDDAVFASSLLVLIEHRTKNEYMGTTVVVIPQCTGETPLEFFLYLTHRKQLIKILEKLGK